MEGDEAWPAMTCGTCSLYFHLLQSPVAPSYLTLHGVTQRHFEQLLLRFANSLILKPTPQQPFAYQQVQDRLRVF